MKSLSYLAVVFLLLVIPGIFCKKKGSLSKLDETIYVKTDGADMPVHLHGNVVSGVFVVVLHGGPGSNGLGYRFGKYATELEKRYVMAYWDQRGQGMSAGNYNKKELTIQKMTEDLYGIVLVLKERYGQDIDVFILGHSWGGTLGTAFMINDDFQKEVAGWIESDGAHDMPKLDKEAIKMFQKVGNEKIEAGEKVVAWQEIVDFANSVDTNNISRKESLLINQYGFIAEGLLRRRTPRQSKKRKVSVSKMVKNPVNPLTGLISGSITSVLLENETDTTSLTSRLHKIVTPTLLIWGKYDFVVPSQLGQDAFRLIGTTEKKLVILEHSGHSPMASEPEEFVTEVTNFIELYRK